ncbi:uncharacterized protein LY89DRAFT_789057 [Mollisia scopiformis]|uniref:Uncharacterized protein n=1 Tax=Mollisia scopiformis TaxID=149040 RepID=A0A132B742_MOLSC|nr:uncharacterized protein LY89DRAFT_789057 [Mollisia scopiformis]KUJ08222.1 hypothetical protein LY89DRAFT_789057 [Mollisia scopiformis]
MSIESLNSLPYEPEILVKPPITPSHHVLYQLTPQPPYQRRDLQEQDTILSTELSHALTYNRDNKSIDPWNWVWAWTGLSKDQRQWELGWRDPRWSCSTNPAPEQKLSPKYFAVNIARLMLRDPRIRAAVLKFCMKNDWGLDGGKVIDLFVKYLMDLFIEAWVYLDLVDEKRYGEPKSLLKKLFGTSHVERLKERKRWVYGKLSITPTEFVTKVAMVDKFPTIGVKGWSEQGRKQWVGRDFIHFSGALRDFKEGLRGLRKVIVDVEAIEI